MNRFSYKTFGGWIKSFGIKISDLTEDELADAEEELGAIKAGLCVDDSILLRHGIEKEA